MSENYFSCADLVCLCCASFLELIQVPLIVLNQDSFIANIVGMAFGFLILPRCFMERLRNSKTYRLIITVALFPVAGLYIAKIINPPFALGGTMLVSVIGYAVSVILAVGAFVSAYYDSQSEWMCERCTLKNSTQNNFCDACHTARSPQDRNAQNLNEQQQMIQLVNREFGGRQNEHPYSPPAVVQNIQSHQQVKYKSNSKGSAVWACPTCTLENPIEAENCSVCGLRCPEEILKTIFEESSEIDKNLNQMMQQNYELKNKILEQHDMLKEVVFRQEDIPLGMSIYDGGRICRIKTGGTAERLGIKNGWVVVKIDDEVASWNSIAVQDKIYRRVNNGPCKVTLWTKTDELNELKSQNAIQDNQHTIPTYPNERNSLILSPQEAEHKHNEEDNIRNWREIISQTREETRLTFRKFLPEIIANHLELCVFTDCEMSPAVERVDNPEGNFMNKPTYLQVVHYLTDLFQKDPVLADRVARRDLLPQDVCKMVPQMTSSNAMEVSSPQQHILRQPMDNFNSPDQQQFLETQPLINQPAQPQPLPQPVPQPLPQLLPQPIMMAHPMREGQQIPGGHSGEHDFVAVDVQPQMFEQPKPSQSHHQRNPEVVKLIQEMIKYRQEGLISKGDLANLVKSLDSDSEDLSTVRDTMEACEGDRETLIKMCRLLGYFGQKF